MTTRFRTTLVSAAAAALLLPFLAALAGAAPASASSPRPHVVAMYKVEKHVDLSGEFPDNAIETTLSCSGGDYVLDGMWRVDHVDQANPPETTGDERDVYVNASYGDATDTSQWHYRITNYADGDAQLKLFLTCIRGQVEQAYNHAHGVVLSGQYFNVALPLVAGGQELNFPATCNAGEVAVAPGFSLADNDHKVRVYRSLARSAFRSWRWAFYAVDPGVGLTTTMRCLQVKTTPGGNGPHAHNLMWAGRPWGDQLVGQWLDVVGAQERRIACDDGADGRYYQDYKAMVASFYLGDPTHEWFLGMDPRPKQRAYKFWWDGGGDNAAYLNVLCIRTKTGKQIAP
ncbi:MAG: hypothetical protein H6529_15005 [Nocardioides sp.]|nr:hypothetical protein [Nocardioides sp.]